MAKERNCVFGPGSICVSNAKLMKEAMDKGDNARAYKLISGFIEEFEKKQGAESTEQGAEAE